MAVNDAGAPPVATVIQLSDLHVVAPGRRLRGGVDPLAAVAAALEVVESADVDVAALVLSGDLTDSGDPAAYRALRGLVEPAARRIGAPLVYAMGNHDDRAALRAGLLGAAPTTEPYDHVLRTGGLRIVVLDSTVPGHHHGVLEPEQLAWLSAELAEPAPLGTLLVLHHPPVPTAFAPMRGNDLHDPVGLARVVTGTDVRMVVCGHTHHAGASALAGVPVWIGPATAHRAELLSPPGRARGRAGVALSRIDVYADAVVAAAEPLDDAAVLVDTDAVALTAAAGARAPAP
ncbi:metallophosphoesterase [Pseudonocardia xinjiangensis]|uniref:metallophosphoesterase n=1 Tax=Pseudonocardia xinjiangensis TaxID=75289 RepID=UPI003D904EC6